MASKLLNIRSLDSAQLNELLTKEGFPSFRTKQILSWLWDKNVARFQEMQNLGGNVIAFLESHFLHR